VKGAGECVHVGSGVLVGEGWFHSNLKQLSSYSIVCLYYSMAGEVGKGLIRRGKKTADERRFFLSYPRLSAFIRVQILIKPQMNADICG
jgi:hypothetical protein